MPVQSLALGPLALFPALYQRRSVSSVAEPLDLPELTVSGAIKRWPAWGAAL